MSKDILDSIIKPLRIIVVILLMLLAIGFAYIPLHKNVSKNNAKALITEMFQFNNYTDLNTLNMPKIKKLTTESVYNSIKLQGNLDRGIGAYLQFRDKPCSVKIITVTDNYIIYSLDNQFVSDQNKYITFYKTNFFGKISDIKECQIRDAFTTTN